MDILDEQEYTINTIKNLMENKVEESIYLDYKAAGALSKENKKISLQGYVASIGFFLYGISHL